MAIFTPRFNLRKPDRTEYFSIVRDFNDNWDKLDLLVAKETDLQAVESRVDVIESDVVIIESDIDSLELRVTTAESDIDNLELSKVDKITGKGLSENDYTDADKLLLTETIPAQLAEITQDITDLGNDKVDKLKATNLVTNGDFSVDSDLNGIADGFLGGGSNFTAPIIQNNTQKWMPLVGGTFSSSLLSLFNLPLIGTNKYYIAFSQINLGSIFVWGDVNNSQLLMALTSDGKTSKVFIPSFGNGNYRINFYSRVANVQSSVSPFSIIDLTATFGVGNEPTAEQMDRLFAEFPNSWFDGTQEILPLKVVPQLLEEKANKAQEAWITPTLLNGWTQFQTDTIQYMKDEMGFVHIQGTISGGTVGASAFVLPVGYRPANTNNRFNVVSNNVWGRVRVLSSGVVEMSSVSNAWASLDGLSFKGV